LTRPDDPLGRRSLFSVPDEAATASGAPPDEGGARHRPPRRPAGEGGPVDESAGRRALFSTPQVSGRSVIVTCRTCRARTPLSLPDAIRRLLPSVWLPLSPWSRWMRCPSCDTFSWCRVEWSHLISGR
jgi:hypothetical protein